MQTVANVCDVETWQDVWNAQPCTPQRNLVHWKYDIYADLINEAFLNLRVHYKSCRDVYERMSSLM